MILYQYQCETCDTPLEAWSTVDARNEPRDCGQCPGLAQRVITPTVTTWNCKGSDPSFPSAYEKWANDRDKRVQKAVKAQRDHGDNLVA